MPRSFLKPAIYRYFVLVAGALASAVLLAACGANAEAAQHPAAPAGHRASLPAKASTRTSATRHRHSGSSTSPTKTTTRRRAAPNQSKATQPSSSAPQQGETARQRKTAQQSPSPQPTSVRQVHTATSAQTGPAQSRSPATTSTTITPPSSSRPHSAASHPNGPMLASITPRSGPAGTRLSLLGSNFGTQIGTVSLVALKTTGTAPAHITLTVRSWGQNRIVAVIPSGLAPGFYEPFVRTATGLEAGPASDAAWPLFKLS